MRIKGKKQVDGKTVVVFNAEGATIADIVPTMMNNGWEFTDMTVTYLTRSGTTTKKEVQAEAAPSIYDRHHFDRWTFTAVLGRSAVTASLDSSRDGLVLTKSTNGGIKHFMQLTFPAPKPAPPDSGAAAVANSAVGASRTDTAASGYQPTPQQYAEPDTASQAAAAALYGDDPTNQYGYGDPYQNQYQNQYTQQMQQYPYAQNYAPEAYGANAYGAQPVNGVMGNADRDRMRQEDEEKIAKAKKKKHIIMLLLFIIQIPSVSIFPAVMGLVYWIKSRKLIKNGDLSGHQDHIKTCRWLLGVSLLMNIAIITWLVVSGTISVIPQLFQSILGIS